VPSDTSVDDNRTERVLATMVATVVVLSIACFVAMLVVGLAGGELSGGIWPVVVMVPYVGLPIGLLGLIALLIIRATRMRRASRDADR
jgi:predicted PurR-regulated permease PerM